jgi:alpha-beta hydrolase superfamily lysophospholipase
MSAGLLSRSVRTMVCAAIVLVLLLVAVLGAAIAFGGPTDPPVMASINEPFRHVDFSDLPAPSQFVARDGAALSYRAYPGGTGVARGGVVLVHGSSGSGTSMHVLAKALAAAGYAAYALDIRGHGASGSKGQIAYIGQLEDDLADFMHAVNVARPATLAGFSSGGGFVLRFAGSARQDQFQSCLLLSPYLTHTAPTYRPDSGGWVKVGVPRIVALTFLNAVGIGAFNDLLVTRFALSDDARKVLTPAYSFALASNFAPQPDYAENIRTVRLPCAVLAGDKDEAFHADRFAAVFREQGKDWPVTLLPGIGHIALTLDPGALAAVVKALDGLRGAPPR